MIAHWLKVLLGLYIITGVMGIFVCDTWGILIVALLITYCVSLLDILTR